MKAYVTSVGEKTERICIEQLQRFGFEVVLLGDPKQTWIEKYRQFIIAAKTINESCIHVDADVIVNENISEAFGLQGYSMAQFTVYDLYQNNLHIGQPVYYSVGALNVIDSKFKELDPNRPEASAWRLPEINPDTYNVPGVAGMHGFFQDAVTVNRAELNKIIRGQIGKYDFDLVFKLRNL